MQPQNLKPIEERTLEKPVANVSATLGSKRLCCMLIRVRKFGTQRRFTTTGSTLAPKKVCPK